MLSEMLTSDYSVCKPKPAELITLTTDIDDHAHEHLQIVIGLSGLVEFDINGCGNRILPGQGCIITESSDHAFRGVGSPSDIFVLNLIARTETNKVILQEINELAHSNFYFQIDCQLRQLIKLLVMEVASNPNDDLLGQSCNNTIIALLNRHIQIFQSQKRSKRLDIEAIDRYIEQHINSIISVSQLAGSVFLSESQFHHQFKETIGLTPHQYVLQKRIQYAKSLMEHGSLSLSHIAQLSGFSGHSTFTHAFCKQVGVSPSRYRKSNVS